MSESKNKPASFSQATHEARLEVMRKINSQVQEKSSERRRQIGAEMLGELVNSAAFIDNLFAKFDGHLIQALASNSEQGQLVLSYEEVEGIRNRLADVSRFLQSIKACA